MGFISWVKNLFHKAEDEAKKAWAILEPVLIQIFQAELGILVAGLKDLALQAITQIAAQGLPNDAAKRQAFMDYMKAALKKEGKTVGQQALDTALTTWLAYAKTNNLPH